MLEDLRELVRQRVWLVKIGRATKSAEETADDILSLVVKECAKIAQGWDTYNFISTGPHRDEGHIDFRGSMKQLTAEILKLSRRS